MSHAITVIDVLGLSDLVIKADAEKVEDVLNLAPPPLSVIGFVKSISCATVPVWDSAKKTLTILRRTYLLAAFGVPTSHEEWVGVMPVGRFWSKGNANARVLDA